MDSFSRHFGWIEVLVFAVIALGFGIYQLWSVNREIAADKANKLKRSDKAGHAVGQHELDDR